MTAQKISKPGTGLLAVVAAVSMLAACGTQEAGSSDGGSGDVKVGPGVDADAKTITIGNLVPLTGPVSLQGKPATAAYEAYFNSLNDRGGIDGWTVKIESRDTQLDTTLEVQAFNEVKDSIAMLATTGTPQTQAILPQLTQLKLVTQPYSLGSLWGNYPVLAPVGTPYALQAMNQINYQVENGAEDKKFGVIYQDDDFGKDGLVGYEQAVKDLDLDSVAETTFKAGETNFTAQVQELESAGAEVILCSCNVSAVPPVVSTAYSLGYKPTWLQFSYSFSPTTLSSDGTPAGTLTAAAQPLSETTWTSPFATPAADLPSTEAWDQLSADTEKYAPDYVNYTPHYVFAYANAMVAEQILRKAIDNGDLSRQGIYDAKNSLGEVDLKGVVPDNVTYSGDVEPPSRSTSVSRIDLTVDGFLKVVEDRYVSESAKDFDISEIPHDE